jgi:hypothetical protein
VICVFEFELFEFELFEFKLFDFELFEFELFDFKLFEFEFKFLFCKSKYPIPPESKITKIIKTIIIVFILFKKKI